MTAPTIDFVGIAGARNIEAAGYHPDSRELQVRYRDGTIYRFGHVPEDVYRGFIRSPVPDTFLRHRILNDYPHRRVPPAETAPQPETED